MKNLGFVFVAILILVSSCTSFKKADLSGISKGKTVFRLVSNEDSLDDIQSQEPFKSFLSNDSELLKLLNEQKNVCGLRKPTETSTKNLAFGLLATLVKLGFEFNMDKEIKNMKTVSENATFTRNHYVRLNTKQIKGVNCVLIGRYQEIEEEE